jgi:hypothetical protein
MPSPKYDPLVRSRTVGDLKRAPSPKNAGRTGYKGQTKGLGCSFHTIRNSVDELARYLVLPLNSPPHYPPYNGGIECAVRELKTPLVEKILDHGSVLEFQVQVWAEVLGTT